MGALRKIVWGLVLAGCGLAGGPALAEKRVALIIGNSAYETLPLERVLIAVEPAKQLRLVILDACRDNPFSKTMKRTVASRAIGRGLAKVEPTSPNTIIAFAAKAGSTASDGDSKNSPFAVAAHGRALFRGREKVVMSLLPRSRGSAHMKDMQASLERLRADAADAAIIRDLATDPQKRAPYTRLADHLSRLADEVELSIKQAGLRPPG